MLTLIAKNIILKWVFGYSFVLSSIALIEQKFTNEEFFNNILNAVPSKVAVVLGIGYGCVILFTKFSKAWREHEVNKSEVSLSKLKVKQAEELLEQEGLNTDSKRENLKK